MILTAAVTSKANKTDVGSGSKAICRVSNVLRSQSPDPKLSPQDLIRMRPFKVKTSYSVRFSPCGATCVTLARDVSLWNISSRKKTWRTHPFSHPSDAAFSPKGDMIAVKSTSGRIVTLSSVTGKICNDFANDADGGGSNLLFSDCGQFILDGSWSGFLSVRNAATGEVQYRREHAGEMICRVHSARSGTAWIIEHWPKATTNDQPTADCYFNIYTWPLSSEAGSAFAIHLPYIRASAVAPDGLRLAVLFGAPPQDLHLYELPSGRLLWRDHVTIGGSGSVLRFAKSGSFVASVQKDCIVHYCSLTGERLRCSRFPFHQMLIILRTRS